MNDSANVKSAKNMKFMGALRLTLEQHAIEIKVTSMTTRATHLKKKINTNYCIETSVLKCDLLYLVTIYSNHTI